MNILMVPNALTYHLFPHTVILSYKIIATFEIVQEFYSALCLVWVLVATLCKYLWKGFLNKPSKVFSKFVLDWLYNSLNIS